MSSAADPSSCALDSLNEKYRKATAVLESLPGSHHAATSVFIRDKGDGTEERLAYSDCMDSQGQAHPAICVRSYSEVTMDLISEVPIFQLPVARRIELAKHVVTLIEQARRTESDISQQALAAADTIERALSDASA